jgi:hypothetical protein
MSNVISIAAMRADRLKQALSSYACSDEAVIIQLAGGSIVAGRIICRDLFAEILDGVGEYFVVDYGGIRSSRAVSVEQTSVVNFRGEFSQSHKPLTSTQTVFVLPFTHQRRQ